MPQLLAIHFSLPKNSLSFFFAKKSTHFLATKTTGFTWFHPPKKATVFVQRETFPPVSPEVLAKGEQRHLLDGDRLVLNLGQAWDSQDGMDFMGKNLGWEKTLADGMGKNLGPKGFLVRVGGGDRDHYPTLWSTNKSYGMENFSRFFNREYIFK